MGNCASCGGCSGDCPGCGGCDRSLSLTAEEVAFLKRLGEGQACFQHRRLRYFHSLLR